MHNLESLNLTQLEELRKNVDTQMAALKASEIQALREEVQTRAAALGITLNDLLLPAAKQKTTRGEAKYRDPNNAANVWTGRGRKPLWLVAHLEQGGSLDTVAI